MSENLWQGLIKFLAEKKAVLSLIHKSYSVYVCLDKDGWSILDQICQHNSVIAFGLLWIIKLPLRTSSVRLCYEYSP